MRLFEFLNFLQSHHDGIFEFSLRDARDHELCRVKSNDVYKYMSFLNDEITNLTYDSKNNLLVIIINF